MKTFEEILNRHSLSEEDGMSETEVRSMLEAFKEVHDQAVDLCVEHLEEFDYNNDKNYVIMPTDESIQLVKNML